LTNDFSLAFGNIEINRGNAYRRVVLEQSMPPRSAETLFDGYEPMTLAEREMLAEWFEGGGLE